LNGSDLPLHTRQKAEENKMYYLYPDYYKKFHCIADKCIDTCCAEWQIVIDDESLEKYRNYKGDYQQTLCQNIDWEEGVFGHNKRGKCAFLRDDDLCDMYIHMGEDSLCTTCREYPRHTEEFENLREITLSLSCPEVAKIVMNTTEPITFVTKEDETDECYEEFDYFLFSELEDVREEMIRIIQDRNVNLRDRIDKILQISVSVQRHYDAGSLISWNEFEESDRVCVENEYELFERLFLFLFEEFEILYPQWAEVLVESRLFLFGEGKKVFEQNKEEFETWWNTSNLTPLDIVLEQLVVYFISVYLLGAVYDENILGKVDACIGHTIEIYLLLLGRWLKHGELAMDDVIEVVYRYSREIEHSDENLERAEMLNWFAR
jgi:lysine-N-methylase